MNEDRVASYLINFVSESYFLSRECEYARLKIYGRYRIIKPSIPIVTVIGEFSK